MSSNPNAPHFILAAVKRIYVDLPLLIGANSWVVIQPQINSLITSLEAHPNAYLASTQLFGLLATYEPARQRIAQELKIQEIIAENISEPMHRISYSLDINPEFIDGLTAAALSHIKWWIDPTTFPPEDEDLHNRGFILKDGGVGGATVTFKEMQINPGDFSKLAAGFITTGVGIIAAPSVPLAMPLLVAAGILSTVSALYDTMKTELSEQDASVFWGMIQATGEMRGSGLYESTIIATTNTEREKFGLEILKEVMVRNSLIKLERIKSIEKTGASYRIIEKYTLKD